MTVQVEMPAKYLSLPLLAEAIVKAEVAASGTDFDVPNTKPRISERVGEWRKRLLNLGTRGLIDAYEFDGFGLKKWPDFKVDHDVLCVVNLNDCLYLKDQGLEFVVARDERSTREFELGFVEAALNGSAISWRYWVEQMPRLGAKEASRLLCGLDPDCYPELRPYPQAYVDASENCKRAMKIERLATAAGKTSDTAAGWLGWAQQHRFTIHDGFVLALGEKEYSEKLAAELEALPFSESRIWTESPEVDEDKRLVTFSFAGNLSAQNLSLHEFLDEVSERMERWRNGRFLLVEAAQVLANANKKIEVMSLLEQMETAIVSGTLTIRRNGLPLTGQELGRGRFWNRTIAQEDVNSWLANVKGGYRLADPYRPVVNHFHLRNSRLTPVSTWRQGFLGELDALTLEDASRLASLHAKREVTVTDFLRAAANELIMLKAVVRRDVKVYRFDGKTFCKAGRPDENRILKGVMVTLPLTACCQLAATERASWREFDGYETVDEELMRYVKGELAKEEENLETGLGDCRVMGHSVHALADLYLNSAGEAVEEAEADVQTQSPQHTTQAAQDGSSRNVTFSAGTPQTVTGAVAVKHPDAATEKLGLPTKTIAACFHNIPYDEKNWPKRLSSGDWAESALVSRGWRGGSSSMWNPLMLAQKVIEREPGTMRQQRMKDFNRGFNRHPELTPWKDDWKEFFQLFFDET